MNFAVPFIQMLESALKVDGIKEKIKIVKIPHFFPLYQIIKRKHKINSNFILILKCTNIGPLNFNTVYVSCLKRCFP